MNLQMAVIFDMDGVLIDSYQPHFESWRDLAAEQDLEVTEESFLHHFGRTSREIIASYWEGTVYGPENVVALDNRKEEIFRRIVSQDFPAMPGVRTLLDSLREAGFALAVGSSGPPENIALALEMLGKKGLFGAVVTASDVTHGKPDPQVFLLAAERLGVEPRNCVVIEDAPVGVQAAHAAGMVAVGLASTGRTRQSLEEAELVVDSLEQLGPKVLSGLIAARE